MVAAYALAELSLSLDSASVRIAALRLFTLDFEFYSESLVKLMLEDAVSICRKWNLERISAEIFLAVHPLIPALERFGFYRVFGEKAEDALLYNGSRLYELNLTAPVEISCMAQ